MAVELWDISYVFLFKICTVSASRLNPGLQWQCCLSSNRLHATSLLFGLQLGLFTHPKNPSVRHSVLSRSAVLCRHALFVFQKKKTCANIILFLSDPYVWDQEPDRASWALAVCVWKPEQCLRSAAGVPPERPARTVERPAAAGTGGAARPGELGGWRSTGLTQTSRLVTAAWAGALYFTNGASAGFSPHPVSK